MQHTACFVSLLLGVIVLLTPQIAHSQTSHTYMSLRSQKVHMRVGPGKIYPIIWTYIRRGTPMEIIGKNNEWLQVQDKDGETGWMYYRLLSKVRTAMTLNDNVFLHYHPDNNAGVVARLMKHVVLLPTTCRASWCYITVNSGENALKGWIRRQYIWGIDPSELFEEE
jgi:SH3-like domain-containing protein